MLTVKELKEFIQNIDDNAEVMIESVIINGETMLSKTEDIYSNINYSTGANYLIISPVNVVIE